MEKINLSVEYSETSNIGDFSAEIQALISETRLFAQNAYAPYSAFRVSAGLILESGKIVKGANMENASYPVSICAERTLLSHTVTNYPNEIIKTIAIYVDKSVKSPVPPCGICRQTLLEIELKQKSPIQVILVSKENKYQVFTKSADLLPLYFDGSAL